MRSKLQPVTPRLSLLSILVMGMCFAFGGLRAELPGFVNESLFSPHSASVAKVVPSLAADVVILNGGLEQGIRLGMICRVTRGFTELGDLIIIESQSNRSAALILELSEANSIQKGDIARIKTIQNS